MAVVPLARKVLLLLPLIFVGFLPNTVAFAAAAQEHEPAFRDNFYDVQIRDNQCWIVGYYGTILHSNDRGATWELQRSDINEALFRVIFLDDKTGWISGSYGTILHTRDGGKKWQRQATPIQEQLLGLTFLNRKLGWAVGSRSTILHTEDGGATWVNLPLSDDVVLNDARFIDPKQGWIVGEFGRTYHTRDGGRTWLKQKSPIEVSFVSGESRNLFALLFPEPENGWAFGLDGVVLKTRRGSPWTVVRQKEKPGSSPGANHLFAAAAFNGGLWAVGERGTLLHSDAAGNHWRQARAETPRLSLNGIAFGKDGFGLIAGNRGVILRTEDGGTTWKRLKIALQGQGKELSRTP